MHELLTLIVHAAVTAVFIAICMAAWSVHPLLGIAAILVLFVE